MIRKAFAFCLSVFILFVANTHASVEIEFVDSATGFRASPSVVLTSSSTSVSQEITVLQTGRVTLDAAPGDYSLTATSPDYQPMKASVVIGPTDQTLRFTLDPIRTPTAFLPENVCALHQPDSTVIVGYAGADDTGKALAGVRVTALPSGRETRTDATGYFQIHVPVQIEAEWRVSPAKLVFEKEGYKFQQHENLELWSNGDWIWRVTLDPGTGTRIVDEGGRRIAAVEMPAPDASDLTAVPGTKESVSHATSPTNATVRLPTNIRVLLTNGTVDYVSMETYTARSLAQEWYSSWGNYSGGINCMKAGAVAVRSYAAWYVSNPRDVTYDICATTSCQVYRTSSTANSEAGASQTAGYIVLDANNAISRSEYSSENNSIGFSCGDGYTQPTGGCIHDPVCAGEPRYGHGRGMCQWGTVKWATGLKFSGNGSGYPSNAGPTNGYPKQDWMWIVTHYYPTLTFVQAKPLVIGDDVKVVGTASRTVYMCADGGIASGINCPQVTTKSVGATGVIIEGPLRVTADGRGYTWWKIDWTGGVIGWLPENWLDRVIPVPSAPQNVQAAAVSTNRVNLTWTDQPGIRTGYRVERAAAAGGPWTLVEDISTNALTAYTDVAATVNATNYYRIRSRNLGGNSSYSSVASAVTPGATAPILAAIPNRTVIAGMPLSFGNSIANRPALSIMDFEGFTDGASVMFRTPRFSGSTSAFLDASPNTAAVTSAFPTNGATALDAGVLQANFSFNSSANAWMRLTTGGAAFKPNPVIDFTQGLRFSIYTDRAIKLAIGCRETSNTAGTAIGSDGGNSGTIEFVGAPSTNGTAPVATRSIAAGIWTNVLFEIPCEPVVAFTGDGVLSTSSGLGVFEHLSIVPEAGAGIYNVYLDNFEVLNAWPGTLTYSIDPGAPTNATMHPVTGLFAWTPTDAQAPGVYTFTVRVVDGANPPQTDTKSFAVTVMPRPKVQHVSITNGVVSLVWNSVQDRAYRLQYTENIENANWNDVGTFTATGPALSTTNTVNGTRRFYRLVVVD